MFTFMFDRKYTSNVYSKTSLEYSMYKCLEFIGRAKLKNMGKRMKNKVNEYYRHYKSLLEACLKLA